LSSLRIIILPIALFAAQSVRAAAPVLDNLFPAGAQRGATITLTATGKLEPWPLQAWTDSPAIRFEPSKKPGEFTVRVAPDAPVGPHLVRLYSAEGASALRCFIVGDQSEIVEVEPNDELASAQRPNRPLVLPAFVRLPAISTQIPVPLPLTINGQLDKSGDVDCYAVDLEAGQTLVASVVGRRLGSAIDPMLHLLDESGNEVAFAQDGLGLDPLLAFRAPRDGKYVVRISAFAYPPAADVKLAGGKNGVYRLSLTTGPYVRCVCPSGVTRGARATLRPIGWNLTSDRIDLDAKALLPGEDHLNLLLPGDLGRVRVAIGDGVEVIANRATTRAASREGEVLVPPVNVSGVIAAPYAEDCFSVHVAKGARVDVLVEAAAAGSPLDAVLRIEDAASGKALGSYDDAGPSSDPKIEWTAPADGRFRIVVTDRFHKGGGDYFYRLEVAPPRASVSATLDADAYTVAAGRSAPLKLKIARRNGHATPMVAVATGLPSGVTATSVEIPASGGDVTLTLTAAGDAKPAAAPIRILLLGTQPTRPEFVTAVFEFAKDREKAGTPELIDRTADLWLTVTPPSPATRPATAPTAAPAKAK
jgi:Bacterial pre-peptidase C-terminal domain